MSYNSETRLRVFIDRLVINDVLYKVPTIYTLYHDGWLITDYKQHRLHPLELAQLTRKVEEYLVFGEFDFGVRYTKNGFIRY